VRHFEISRPRRGFEWDPERFKPHCPICVNLRTSLFLSALKLLSRINRRRLASQRNLTQIRKEVYEDLRRCSRTMLRSGETNGTWIPIHFDRMIPDRH
jgi:hypothetical protein